MGTRADFYIGRGEGADWLGSIAWDGYPEGIPASVLEATDAGGFRACIEAMLGTRDDFTSPEMGWPWPWENSAGTDYAYAFDGAVWVSCFGSAWCLAKAWNHHEVEDGPPVAVFPNMAERQRVTYGKRSGLLILPEAP